jgi:hypothetical protein
MASEDKEQWICTALDVEGGIRPGSPIKPVMRGVAAKNDKRWKRGQTLLIYFVNGDQNQCKKFKEIADLWIIGTSLKLETTSNIHLSNIRAWIGLTDGKRKNSSEIGIDSMDPRLKEKPTLRVSEVTEDMVLHEFGHALGLVHEHAHPGVNIEWNKDQVYSDLKESDNWEPGYIDQWVFEKFDSSKQEVITSFDSLSVMMYPIRKNWTKNLEPREISKVLSEGDKATIRKLYPPA